MTPEKLLEKVIIDPITECWNWTGAKFSKGGYGRLWLSGKDRLVHRVSFEIHNGAIPDSMFVCHRCDNRICVNPSHLFLGSPADNMADMVEKKRGVNPRGSSHGRAKLSETDVKAIRYARGIKQKDLAERFGVTQSQISLVRLGKIWKHLPKVDHYER